MSTAVFDRLHARLFARLGEEAVLAGVPCRVLLAHGVEQLGDYGRVVARVTVATISQSLVPAQGQTLEVLGSTYKLDALLRADAHVADYVLIPA